MADEEYEILPHQLLSDLKNEVEALKKKILQPDTKANELILEIESLKDSIHELTNIFKKALEETKEEDLTRVIKAVNEKMEAVISQNETIAKGMVAISDKVDDWVKRQSLSPAVPSAPTAPPIQPRPAPVQHSIGMPSQSGRMAPSPLGMAPRSDMPELPPPPPGMGRRPVGLFK